MKTAGIVLTVLGGLMILSSVRLALTTYDLNSSHDVGKLFGGFGAAVLVLLGGVLFMRKANRKA
jgi:hypothetical protein